MNQDSLSHGDEQVLNQVFDPESAPEAQAVKVDPSLPSDPHITDQSILEAIKSQELQAIRLVEGYSPRPNLAPGLRSTPDHLSDRDCQDKEQIFKKARTILSDLITTYPKYASAYNNRAQLRRWRHGESFIVNAGKEAMNSIVNSTISDLKTAIDLSTPPTLSSSVSPQQAKLLIQSWTQLGVVYWSLGRRWQDNSMSQPGMLPDGDSQLAQEGQWWTWDGTRLEEEGSRCFFMAGLYGSDVGRGLAVKTNPYSRLCGGIVKEALKRESNR